MAHAAKKKLKKFKKLLASGSSISGQESLDVTPAGGSSSISGHSSAIRGSTSRLGAESPNSTPSMDVTQARGESHTSPNHYLDILVGSSQAPAPGPVADATRVVFKGSKTVLGLIERSTDVFPPLKSAVAALLAVIDTIEITSQNKQDYLDLARRLEAVVSIMAGHQDKSNSPSFAGRLDGLSTAIQHQLAVILKQTDRNLARRTAEGKEDAGAIAGAYRTISFLLDAFQMDTSLATEGTADEILAHTLFDKLPLARYAAYNESSSARRHGCTANTREAILAGLVAWSTDPENTKIYWLNGMAGTGKTTIAYTFSEILDQNQMLGASFFCSRQEEHTGDVKRILPTIAHGLAWRFPSVLHALVAFLRKNPNAGDRSMQDQFSNLIVTPVEAASEQLTAKSVVIVIDALDECKDQNAVADLLSIISQHSSTLPVKFFITSRPERQIRHDFNQPGFATHSKFYLHGVEKDIVGLFPTAGSWNPTPTIVGFAQHLAKSLVVPPKRVAVITQEQPVSTTKTLGRLYIIGFKTQPAGAVSLWRFSDKEELPSLSHPLGDFNYSNDRHVCLLADTTGRGFYDLVLFGDTGVSVASRNRDENKFDIFVPSLANFSFYAGGWRVDRHIRYMADLRKTGRADIIGFGEAGIIISKNEPHLNGFRFTTPTIVLNDLCYNQGWRLDRHLRFMADFYGNGVPDIIGFGESSVFLVKNNGDGTFEGPVDLGLDQFTYSQGWRVDRHVRTLANMTGKGRADIVGFGNEGVYVAINNGDGTVGPARLVLKDFGYNQGWRVKRDHRIVADVNGSGLGDIVGFGQNGVHVSKNRGNGRFEDSKLVIRDFGYGQGWRVERHLRFMVDMTGNGCADIVGFGDKGASVAFNDGEGGFGHAQKLTNALGWEQGWDPFKSVRYVERLD